MTEPLITLIPMETNGQWPRSEIASQGCKWDFSSILLISSLERDSCPGCLKGHWVTVLKKGSASAVLAIHSSPEPRPLSSQVPFQSRVDEEQKEFQGQTLHCSWEG